MDLTVVIVTSPARSNPAITLIEQVINSLDNVIPKHLKDNIPIVIVMDGYEVFDKARTKKGRISADMVEKYEEYYHQLKKKYDSPPVAILRLDSHHGFAMAVKEGLLSCKTTFALVLQHDRVFSAEFTHLDRVCQVMLQNSHMRYVGFPTVMSQNHQMLLKCRYSLLPLIDPAQSHVDVIPDEIVLQPLIFWYDSNHLAHVERYLQIYAPYYNLTEPLREALGLQSIKRMLLRRGDFIEDRFGQQQRDQLTSFKEQECVLMDLFQWYGCYLIWNCAENVMVGHLRGRHYDPVLGSLRVQEALETRKENEKAELTCFDDISIEHDLFGDES